MKLTGILINRKSPVPLQRQLENGLREAILSGQLGAGERILSSRELQTHLGLGRNTIVNALDQLHAEGYLHTVRGVGTFVLQHGRPAVRPLKNASTKTARSSEAASRNIAAWDLAANATSMAPFRPGLPDLSLFPSSQFRRSFQAAAWTADLLGYEEPFGHLPLRETIAKRLRQTRGMACSAEDVLITNGAQSAFALIARVLLNNDDLVAIEDPGYANVRAAMLGEGARVFGAPVDEDGLLPGSVPKLTRMVCVSPSHQYPTGVVLSLERRFALLDWAAKNDAWILEDDYDTEFNYTNRPQPALHGLDNEGRVIYVGTFSKVLSPGLRTGYIVLPPSLRAPFEATHLISGGAPSTVIQAALAHFIDTGSLGRHIAKMRRVYDERRCFVRDELVSSIGKHIQIQDSCAGLHFIAYLRGNRADTDISSKAAAKGLIVPALSSYYYDNSPRNGLLMGFAIVPPAQAKPAIAVLSKILKDA